MKNRELEVGSTKKIGIPQRQGKFKLLINQLSIKFSSLPQDILNSIENADDETLDALGKDIFNLKSLEDVLKHLHQ